MALMQFRTPSRSAAPMAAFLQGASIEVMPRTAAGVSDLRDRLPAGTLVFVAHIDGTAPADMQATVARLARDGFRPVPHVPARIVPSRAALNEWVAGYRDAGAEGALLLGGGLSAPKGEFRDSMQLLETGLFGDFRHLFIAGHPEGNRDIDPAFLSPLRRCVIGHRHVNHFLACLLGFTNFCDGPLFPLALVLLGHHFCFPLINL